MMAIMMMLIVSVVAEQLMWRSGPARWRGLGRRTVSSFSGSALISWRCQCRVEGSAWQFSQGSLLGLIYCGDGGLLWDGAAGSSRACWTRPVLTGGHLTPPSSCRNFVEPVANDFPRAGGPARRPQRHYFLNPSHGGRIQMVVAPSDLRQYAAWVNLAQLAAAETLKGRTRTGPCPLRPSGRGGGRPITDVSSPPQGADKHIKMPDGRSLLECAEDAAVKALLQ